MKRLGTIILLLATAGSAVGQKLLNTTDRSKQKDGRFFPISSNNSLNNNQQIPDSTFCELMLNDIALLNGLDKGADLMSKLNIDLIDDPSIKLTINGKKAKYKKQRFVDSKTYFSNYVVEIGLKEDLIDLFKDDKRQFKGSFSYSGTLFFNKKSRYKYDPADARSLDNELAKNRARVFECNDGAYYIQPINGGDTTYYRRSDRCQAQEVYRDMAAAEDAAYEKAKWVSKKFYWFSYELKGGVEGLNFYDSTDAKITRAFKPTFSADFLLNFYHWTNPKYDLKRSRGTKFISGGLFLGYQPMDDVSQNDYISIENDPDSTVSNKLYSTSSAYDKAKYSEIFRIAPHLDYYQFLTKNQLFGIHLGIRGKFDIALEKAVASTNDLDLTAGLVFNIKRCYSECDEDEQASRVNFELLVVAESVAQTKRFVDCLSPKLKVGIPFTMLSK